MRNSRSLYRQQRTNEKRATIDAHTCTKAPREGRFRSRVKHIIQHTTLLAASLAVTASSSGRTQQNSRNFNRRHCKGHRNYIMLRSAAPFLRETLLPANPDYGCEPAAPAAVSAAAVDSLGVSMTNVTRRLSSAPASVFLAPFFTRRVSP